ncbi:MAG: AraC family transcriptional regulator [Paenibacillaceae bacterium]|jgi:two-component system response regulator YesN|nr:AraC family transcriptional regulator [Paenibacillaceae bacterium]
MHKALIVDDEPNVRFGLRNYFDWSSYNIEIMGEADDGDVALELIAEEIPDLILTDVRMPAMDGIELSKRIAKLHPRTKIVFISGYDDAEYLKSALKINAADYIFKPVNLEELETTVKRVVAELEEERKELLLSQELQVKLRESMPLLREKFLLSLMNDAAPRQMQRLQERIKFLGLKLPSEAYYWIIVISVDNRTELRTQSERDWQLLAYAMLNVCQELIDFHLGGYALEKGDDEMIGILLSNEEGEVDAGAVLFRLASQIRDNLERLLKIRVTIGISDCVSGLGGLAGSYKQAREAANSKWYLGKNRIITMDSLETVESEFKKFDSTQNEQLMSALKAADHEKMREHLNEIFGNLIKNRKDGMQYVRLVSLQIILSMNQLLMELNAQTSELEWRGAGIWEDLFGAETVLELRQLLEDYLIKICDRIKEKRYSKAANLVERIHYIIESRYADSELTVAVIGHEVYLTPTYVGLLFKQETGQTINEYLTQYRIKKAKELLRDPKYKLYDICFAIGYTDPSYFTKLFKKMTGVTPSAYRESHV